MNIFLLLWIHLLCLIFSVFGTTYYCDQGNTQRIANQSSGIIITRLVNQQYYGNNMDCNWVIDAGPNKRIKLSINSLNMQWVPQYSLCSGYDSMTVRNGDTDTSPLFAQFCHSNNPQQAVSSGQYLFLNFYTTNQNFYQQTGINLTFEIFDNDTCPPEWDDLSTADKCYSAVKMPPPGELFNRAQQFCGYSNANLVVIDSQAEMDSVKAFATSASLQKVWIGLTDLKKEGTFEWLDGSLGFTNKVISSTNDEDYDCVFWDLSLDSWKADKCERMTHNYVCEKQKVGSTRLFMVPDESEDDKGKGEINFPLKVVLGVIGAVILIIIIGLTAYCVNKHNKTNRNRSQAYHPTNNGTNTRTNQRSSRSNSAAENSPPVQTPVEPVSPPPYEQVLAEDKAGFPYAPANI